MSKKVERPDAAAQAAGNLTKWEVAEFKEAFALFDSKKDGSIDPDELKEMMGHLGQECSDEEIKDMIDVADELSTGRIDFPSFLKQFQHDENENVEQFVQQAFALIGSGGDITGDAIEQFFGQIGLKLISDEINEIVKIADEDGDGKIGLEDFRKLYTKK
ncbi:hypothetical protein RFI_11452 [Reticulomyxa filosa]|uniref:Calmodulin n=1 Tax=Reticulomyxa filosa TaxID=46433 RepID=X6NI57_RETFI|nr:hypothetical protein RFI_11452 [Reticulomyxa filosa]|eukprot:ETO25686.1 hypothetical protein RFI_11452 [Reticulomyxa filosa]